MGGTFSSTSTTATNLNDSPSDSVNPNMSSSESNALESDPQTQPSKSTVDPKTLDDQIVEDSEPKKVSENGGEEGEEEEEEGECGFCLFMKGGGCKESFIGWENCIEEAEKTKEDIVEKCFQVTAALKKCMEAHADYYEPLLRAEKAAEQEALKELEKEKEAKAAAEKGSEQSADQDAGAEKGLEQGADQDAGVGLKDSDSSEKKEG